MSLPFLCQVDHLAWRHGALFGFGWAVDQEGPFKCGFLKLTFEEGRLDMIDLMINRTRTDVAASFPHYANAANAGFMFLAGWVGKAPVTAHLEFINQSGSVHRHDLKIGFQNQQGSGQGIKFRVLIQRARRMLRQRDFGGLWTKVVRYRDAGGFAREGTESELLSLLGNKLIRLIIDHNMGGGANVYRDRQIEGWLENSSDSVVLLSFSLKHMEFMLEIHANGRMVRRRVHDFNILSRVFQRVPLREIFINCLVSFPDLPDIEKAVYRWARMSNAHLIVAIHEYFMICPSHFLLNWRGEYCDIPKSLAECQQCLKLHKDGFVSLARHGNKTVADWRKVWGALLTAADEVRCFSASSLNLIQRVYPALNHQLTLTPHRVEALRKPRLAAPRPTDELVIGVVGSITEHKGALVLDELVRAMEKTGVSLRIVILGVLDSNILIRGVTETGLYDRKDLPDLLEQEGVHLALMPSICPETFSFVTHELISMQVPVACFGLGAQGDIVSRYALGHIVSARDGVGMLRELISFSQEIPEIMIRLSNPSYPSSP